MKPDSTCWTIIQEAADGEEAARERFARSYTPVVRAYLGNRWNGTPCADDVDDALQEVFVECFRRDGVLDRADARRPGGFRAFLYGVVRNVARRVESRKRHDRELPPGSGLDPAEMRSREPSLSRLFDQAWARALLREARGIQAERARQAGEDAVRRVELLTLRFQQDLPIREIAALWETEATLLYTEYARAKREFREALVQVVSFHHPGTAGEVDRECAALLALFE